MTDTTGTAHPTSVRHPGLVLGVVCLATYAVLVEGSIVNVALPSFVRQLEADTTALKWIVDAYNLVFAALVLVGGTVSDRYGRRRLLVAGLVVFTLGNAVAALATGTVQLVAARGVMGLGAALVFPTTLSIITNTFTDRTARAKAIGAWGAMTGLGVASGPILGGWILEHFYWGSVFVLMVPMALIALVAALVVIPESSDPAAPSIDVRGVALSTIALAALVVGIIQAPDWGWLAGRTWIAFVVAATAGWAFVDWERRVADPMLDVALFRNARFSAASGAIAVAFFALFGFIFLITQYFQFVRGYGTLESGLRTLPVAISIGVAAVTGTPMAVRFGNRAVVTGGLVLLGASFCWIGLVVRADTPYGVIVCQMVLMGIGLGCTTAPATESIMGAVPKEKAGQGSAVNDATREVGGTLGIAVIGSIYASLYGAALTASTVWSEAPEELRRRAEDGIGLALGAVAASEAQLGAALAGTLRTAAQDAFLDGLSVACLVAAGMTWLGAVGAGSFLPARPADQTSGSVASGPTAPIASK